MTGTVSRLGKKNLTVLPCTVDVGGTQNTISDGELSN